MTENAKTEIQNLDNARSAALLTNDWEKLRALLADDLVHVHANGLVEDKPTYLAALAEKLEFLKITRPPLEIRVFGEVAIATGSLQQTVRVRASGAVVEMQAIASQVWVKRASGWLLTSFQATRIG